MNQECAISGRIWRTTQRLNVAVATGNHGPFRPFIGGTREVGVEAAGMWGDEEWSFQRLGIEVAPISRLTNVKSYPAKQPGPRRGRIGL